MRYKVGQIMPLERADVNRGAVLWLLFTVLLSPRKDRAIVGCTVLQGPTGSSVRAYFAAGAAPWGEMLNSTGFPLWGWKLTRAGLRCQAGAGHSESGVLELEAAPKS